MRFAPLGFDAMLVFVTAFAAIFISVENSILIGVVVSLLLFVPRVSKLGDSGTDRYAERVVRERLKDESASPGLASNLRSRRRALFWCRA